MIRQYNISGMTCTACKQIVHDSISKLAEVKKVTVDLDREQANIEMGKYIPIEVLQTALEGSLYQISETAADSKEKQSSTPVEEALKENKALVSDYVTAVGQFEHEQLHKYLHPDFEFNGAMNLHSADDFIEMIKEHANSTSAGILQRNDIKAIFVDENECCVIYDAVTDSLVRTVPFVEWIKIKDGKILSTDVKFNQHRMRQLMQEVRKSKN